MSRDANGFDPVALDRYLTDNPEMDEPGDGWGTWDDEAPMVAKEAQDDAAYTGAYDDDGEAPFTSIPDPAECPVCGGFGDRCVITSSGIRLRVKCENCQGSGVLPGAEEGE